uniref:Uncharacterized protein n=1 Tax=Solanum tuberosum TaxID=4113 RepID=M1C6V9_SOLTU
MKHSIEGNPTSFASRHSLYRLRSASLPSQGSGKELHTLYTPQNPNLGGKVGIDSTLAIKGRPCFNSL